LAGGATAYLLTSDFHVYRNWRFWKDNLPCLVQQFECLRLIASHQTIFDQVYEPELLKKN
jgi:hypothetical protein